jgi:hypothetical protein
MHVHRLRLLALVVGLVGGHMVTVTACSDRTTEPAACYPEGLEWEDEGPPYHFSLGWCQWPREDFQWGPDGNPPKALPDAPPDVQLRPQSYCFDLEDGEACDACPAEETDALLRERFEERCGYESTYFSRGCYELGEDEEGRPRCCYKAIMGPACPSGG